MINLRDIFWIGLFVLCLFLAAHLWMIHKTPAYVPPKQPTEQERKEHRKRMKQLGAEQTWCVEVEKDGSEWFTDTKGNLRRFK
jgi:hypothetical protein